MVEKRRGPGRPKGSKNKNKVSDKSLSKAKSVNEKSQKEKKIIDDIFGISIIAIGIFLIYTTQLNATGEFGHIIHDTLKGLFGTMAYILPYMCIIYGIAILFKKIQHIGFKTTICAFLIYFMLCMLNSVRFISDEVQSFGFNDLIKYYNSGVQGDFGGMIGMELGNIFVKFFGKPGLIIISLAIIIISLLLIVNTPISKSISDIRERKKERKLAAEFEKEEKRQKSANGREIINKDGTRMINNNNEILLNDEEENEVKKKNGLLKYFFDNESLGKDAKKSKKNGYGLDGEKKPISGYGIEDRENENNLHIAAYQKDKESKPTKEEEQELYKEIEETNKQSIDSNYKLPSINLLKKTGANKQGTTEKELKEKAILLEETLKNFKVMAKVLGVTEGPSVTRYEVQPAIGVKVNSIVNLADDIALNMRAKSIRIEAPIPGKAAVGIEIENENFEGVSIREMIESKEFKDAKSKISFAVGKNISGKNIIADLKNMPHLLIAGATGSGKSVCINSIIASILYKAKPSDVKMVLIDPKVVELGNYNGIPHMLIPVVTEPKKAAAALNWAVNEMNNRYKQFAELGVKDLESYNDSMKTNNEPEKALPQIVIIIDELADLMMASPSQVEESISRLAQMARAAGMHLIVATQRPSVDVVTGLIKANIPSRIAFSVSSQFDSRTILDMNGAEKLLGKGDMLFLPMNKNKPIRVQGPYISEKETLKIINFVKEQKNSEYDDEIIKAIETPSSEQLSFDGDEILNDAIKFIFEQEKASVSMLQRKFRIGYNRAARIIDQIEALGIIGKADGMKTREILMSKEEYYNKTDNEIEEK